VELPHPNDHTICYLRDLNLNCETVTYCSSSLCLAANRTTS